MEQSLPHFVLTLPQNFHMSGILFDDIVFGPLKSRRFGISLGINLLPAKAKICSFNCIYCECGLTGDEAVGKARLFTPEEIRFSLEERLKALQIENIYPDNITFAGNGEPTLHPKFAQIVDVVCGLRDTYFPKSKITVLSNSTMLSKPTVHEALLKVDNNVLKLDAGTQLTFDRINRPVHKILLADVVEQLCTFNGNVTIQTLFLRGKLNGHTIDNTKKEEVNLWLSHLKRIQPKMVMLYPIDRLTPETNLEKITLTELDTIAEQVRGIGLYAEVYF
jgi:wyosine [tRNA(Phe)-imidazoG37] synthetase (radical SAM superfamily)